MNFLFLRLKDLQQVAGGDKEKGGGEKEGYISNQQTASGGLQKGKWDQCDTLIRMLDYKHVRLISWEIYLLF